MAAVGPNFVENLEGRMLLSADAVLEHGTLPDPEGQAIEDLAKRVEELEGHLRMLLSHAPRLMWLGARRRDIGLIAIAFELAVPPLSLLALLLASALTAALVATRVGATWTGACRSSAQWARSMKWQAMSARMPPPKSQNQRQWNGM